MYVRVAYMANDEKRVSRSAITRGVTSGERYVPDPSALALPSRIIRLPGRRLHRLARVKRTSRPAFSPRSRFAPGRCGRDRAEICARINRSRICSSFNYHSAAFAYRDSALAIASPLRGRPYLGRPRNCAIRRFPRRLPRDVNTL